MRRRVTATLGVRRAMAAAGRAVREDSRYLGTMADRVLAIDWRKAAILWQYAAPRRQQPFYASAAVTEKLVIVGSRDKRVHAIDRMTGKEVWTYATEHRV